MGGKQMKPKVFITRRLPEQIVESLSRHVALDFWEDETPPPYAVLRRRVADKQGLLCLLSDRVDRALIENAPELKVVSQIAVGYDNIDVAAATERGVKVGNTPDVLTEASADFTFTLLLMAARRAGEAIQYIEDGKWRTWGLTTLMGNDVYGATLGIIGLGRIGRAVAERARGFKMQVLYHNRTRNEEAERTLGVDFCPLDELLARSDFVSLHVSLNEQTEGLIGREELHQMKNTAVLINTARGPIVNHDALYEALRNDDIRYAALDVTDPEPLPANHKLLKLPNIIVTPHIASATTSTRLKMCEMAVNNLLAGLEGEELPFGVNSFTDDK